MKKPYILSLVLFLSAGFVFAQDANKAPAPVNPFGEDLGELPPNPKPGECYMRTRLPAQYKTVSDQVWVTPDSQKFEITDAVFKTEDKRVMVHPERTEHKVIPAVYETKTHKVMVQPEKEVMVEVPAQFKTIKEKVLIKPAEQVWKRGTGPLTEINNSAGDLLCLVTVPAVYKEVTRQELVKEAGVSIKKVPAEYVEYTETILKSAARVEERKIPAEYKVIKVQVPVSGPSKKAVPVKRTFAAVERNELVTPERMGWVRVLCETNLTEDRVKDIQNALKAANHDVPVTGKLGKATMSAVRKYTSANRLPMGLTYELMDKLGVK